MKKAQRIIISVIAFILVISMAACSKSADGDFDMIGDAGMNNAPSYGYPNANKGESALEGGVTLEGDAVASPEDAPAEDIGDKDEEVEQSIYENPFIKVEEMDTSTFSADVDTASYTFLRKMINQGYSLSELQNTAKYNVLRTEEMVNYFKYDYASPAENEVFGVNATISKSPWNDETYLMMLGIKATEIEEKTANNLVFLIDASGSMSSADKLPLLQEAFVFLTEQLDENDTVSIVTYAGSERVVLEGASGNKKQTIIDAINDLKAGGSTNGEAGINKAYEIAEANFKPGGNNRIILASDGDLNVGIRDPEQLEKLVEEKRDAGIFLSVLAEQEHLHRLQIGRHVLLRLFSFGEPQRSVHFGILLRHLRNLIPQGNLQQHLPDFFFPFLLRHRSLLSFFISPSSQPPYSTLLVLLYRALLLHSNVFRSTHQIVAHLVQAMVVRLSRRIPTSPIIPFQFTDKIYTTAKNVQIRRSVVTL